MSADEIAFLEGMTIVYKNSIDLSFYVVGSAQENEVLSFLVFFLLTYTYRYSHKDFTFYFILCKISKAMALSYDFFLCLILLWIFFFYPILADADVSTELPVWVSQSDLQVSPLSCPGTTSEMF